MCLCVCVDECGCVRVCLSVCVRGDLREVTCNCGSWCPVRTVICSPDLPPRTHTRTHTPPPPHLPAQTYTHLTSRTSSLNSYTSPLSHLLPPPTLHPYPLLTHTSDSLIRHLPPIPTRLVSTQALIHTHTHVHYHTHTHTNMHIRGHR